MVKNKKAFTLVELLAVIVILAIILVIAVPSIMDTIKESRKGALASSAKLIASSAETAYISNQTLGIEKDIECSDVSSYTEEDYTCSLEFVGDKAHVTLEGHGKFEGLYVCSGTKDDAEAAEEACTGGSGGSVDASAVAKIESLATETNTEGLELTSDENIRYTGESPKNYIKFNDEDWRIIGIFNIKTVNETTGEEKTEKLMKIVKNDSIGSYSWDSSDSSVNSGQGINEWSQADLKTELNTLYLKSESGYCCNNKNQATCDKDSEAADCNFTNKGIKDTYREMVENVEWNTGTFSFGKTPVLTAYNAERETKTGKECSSGTSCNDSVTRTTTWTGKVGLIYPSDFGYASTNKRCRENINDKTNYSCKNDNWLHNDTHYWTILPNPMSGYANNAWFVGSVGYVSSGVAVAARGVRPAIYLKSNVSITSGEGTQTSPYHLSMN